MKIKNVIYVMLCVCVALTFSGCNHNKNQGDLSPTPTESPVPTLAGSSEKITIAPPENLEVTIYSINPSTLEKMAVTVLMTEVTAESIVEEVVSAMKDEAFFIGINDVILQGDAVIVDFKSDAPPVIDVGSSVEGTILDAIGQSVLDNLPECGGVIFRIEGGPYETGHFELGIDEVYIRR